MNFRHVLIVLAAVAVVVLVVLTILPMFGHRGGHSGKMTNATQLRGIQMAMVIYADGNKGYFPGCDSQGTVVAPTSSDRFAVLLDFNGFTPDYIIAPRDNAVEEATRRPASQSVDFEYVVTPANFSYAMLDIRSPGGRRDAWRDTQDDEEVVIADRNTGTDTAGNIQSVWKEEPGEWQGTIVRNDNSTSFEKSHLVPTGYPQGVQDSPNDQNAYQNPDDHLFDGPTPNDALLVHD